MQKNESSPNKWLVMAAVSTGIFLATIDGSIVNIALPTLKADLSADFAVIQWVVLAYLLTVVTLMLGIGRLGDMIGKKPLYTIGFIIFTIGSGLCGLAQNAAMLIFFRVVQACGAAMIMALGTAIVTEAFPPQERGKALGITGLMVSLGSITGPTIGGLILGALSWHWIFFVNLPLGIIGIFMVIRFVPASQTAGRQRFDFAGAAALFVSLLALLMALTLGETDGFTSLLVWGLFALFLSSLAFFIWLEQRTADPIIDLSLFKNSLFSVNLITGFLTFVCSAGLV
nr:MFS transporter [Anaerolineaceae bacterium]